MIKMYQAAAILCFSAGLYWSSWQAIRPIWLVIQSTWRTVIYAVI